MSYDKDEWESAEFRSLGNREFIKGNFFEALLCYNKSLCFAEHRESMSKCYANRSAVYFKLKLYDNCINNIKLARRYNYPRDFKVRQHLTERENNCKKEKAIRNPNDNNTARIKEFLQMSYPADPKLPFASKCLKLEENEKFGKHVVASRDLIAGDIIAITPNIYNVIDFEYASNHHCSFCLKSNNMDLIPCKECPSGK
jgi:SET and MYND domain-containing protein 4